MTDQTPITIFSMEERVTTIVTRVANVGTAEEVDTAVRNLLSVFEDHYSGVLEAITGSMALDGLQAEAFNHGVAAGKSRAMRHMSDEPGLSLDVENPYRRAATSDLPLTAKIHAATEAVINAHGQKSGDA